MKTILADHGMYGKVEVPVKATSGNGLVVTKQRDGYIILVETTGQSVPGSFRLLKDAKRALVLLAPLFDWNKLTNGKNSGFGSKKEAQELGGKIMEIINMVRETS